LISWFISSDEVTSSGVIRKIVALLSFEIPTPEPEPVQEQPYWSGEEWEKWAFSIYQHYQQYRKFLPEWFIDAVEEELKQRRR